MVNQTAFHRTGTARHGPVIPQATTRRPPEKDSRPLPQWPVFFAFQSGVRSAKLGYLYIRPLPGRPERDLPYDEIKKAAPRSRCQTPQPSRCKMPGCLPERAAPSASRLGSPKTSTSTRCPRRCAKPWPNGRLFRRPSRGVEAGGECGKQENCHPKNRGPCPAFLHRRSRSATIDAA